MTEGRWNALAAVLVIVVAGLAWVLAIARSEQSAQTVFRFEERETAKTAAEEVSEVVRRVDGFETKLDTLTIRVERIEDALRGVQ